MELKKEIEIKLQDGLHTRVIAAIAKQALGIEKKYNVRLYIEYKERGIAPISALMSFMFFKVRKGEKVTIYSKGEGDVQSALDEIEPLFSDKINILLNNEVKKIDNIITDKAITIGSILNSIDNGIVATEKNEEINFCNSATKSLLGVVDKDLIGTKIEDIFDDFTQVVSSYKSEVYRGKKGDKTLLVYKNPLIADDVNKGNIYILEDVSILEEIIDELSIVKELKEKLQLILDTVGDGVCLINNEGIITYVNDNYRSMVEMEDLIGKSIYELSPNGVRRKVLENGEPAIGEIVEKGSFTKVVCSVYPLKVDDKQVGVVSFIKEISDVKKLSQKLDKASERVKYLEEELYRTKKPHKAFDKYIGKSGKVQDSLALATKAAKSKATVIIRGDSGTGKELIAEGIHYASERSNGPFIRVNCAAIPESLIESELFGYEKGAFTGAVKRKLGKFELAQKGTIFLDEIGEMDKNMQSKILRVLQYKEFQRVGGEQTVHVDVRIIAATHRNLEEMVKSGDFREDLYYRLNVIPIYLPKLQERKEDIPLLVNHFIDKLQVDKRVKGISTNAMNTLIDYNWKGNVRELENILEGTIALCEGEIIHTSDLPGYIFDVEEEKPVKNKPTIIKENKIEKDEIVELINGGELLTLKEYEKLIIEKALKENGSYNKAAKALGITHRTVALKAKQYGIEKIVTWG